MSDVILLEKLNYTVVKIFNNPWSSLFLFFHDDTTLYIHKGITLFALDLLPLINLLLIVSAFCIKHQRSFENY
ncbi:unnamed protein product [Rotaria magnacalcarata]